MIGISDGLVGRILKRYCLGEATWKEALYKVGHLPQGPRDKDSL